MTVEAAKRGARRGVSLHHAVAMVPTPSARDYRSGRASTAFSEKHNSRPRGKTLAWTQLNGKPPSDGTLNPDWVEWLMGVPSGWTSLYTLSTPHYGWPLEPPIPRVTTGAVDRVDRIRLLGNGVVPQTAAEAWLVLDAELTGRELQKLAKTLDTRGEFDGMTTRTGVKARDTIWATPSANEGGVGKDWTWDAEYRFYRYPDGSKVQTLLNHQVQWATPNTMDHLKPGISASYKESLAGRRKRSSNLRDQVHEDDNET